MTFFVVFTLIKSTEQEREREAEEGDEKNLNYSTNQRFFFCLNDEESLFNELDFQSKQKNMKSRTFVTCWNESQVELRDLHLNKKEIIWIIFQWLSSRVMKKKHSVFE